MAANNSINDLIARAIPGSKGTSNWFAENIKIDTPHKYGFTIAVHFGLSLGSSGIIEYTIDGGLTYQTFINSVEVGDGAGIEREIILFGGHVGYITSYEDSIISPNVKTTITFVKHLLQDGDVVEITENPDYNGVYVVSNVTANTFDIIKLFITNNPIGKFDSADTFNIKSQSAVSINHCRVHIL